MKKQLTQGLLATTAVLPMITAAHPGHDHSSPYAFLIHLAWIAPALLATGLVIYRKKMKNKAK